MTDLSFSRRRVLALGGASAFAALPLPALALNASQAESLVTTAIGEINRVISSGASVNSMVNSFKGIFDRYADTSYLAAYALGNDGRSASNAQKAAFSDAFGIYLANKYGRRFNEFAGGRIEVQGTRAVNSYMEVRTLAILRGQSPFQVDFHVSDRPGRPVFFNLIIEGVNMLLSERAEIGAMLDARGGNLDQLIRDLS
ncbi:ABC transporter substrate-binding protein [Octadecabacter sp. 1_MG-2023]|uniref:MlaC/ttg2D family ABC transporter substrate-binding protein n=1 Tax=unclassified Octadecabacter TaxID=196158 RepID=UPI001C08CBBA|nr:MULTISPECIES: ABC transporter substrate-binding protein [unclassified Octadecabacter]MBU2992547.1 ABC transporter substrate-binding protein [Octadecabacter sp. B2R22]MDO6734696.1 ABC transporter substrate-binding protein [Octadecabacter sp. 1_MG-2023]